jgi:hypothetical protein
MRPRLLLLLGAAAAVAGCGSGERQERAESPEAVAADYLHLDEQRGATTSLVTRQGPEGGDRATVTATLDGLLDDSVAAVRYVLVVVRDDDGWRLVSARRTQRCRAGRGHTAFSAAPCV